MNYKCSLCHKEVDGDLLVFIDHTEVHIMEEIKTMHPEWANEDGVCKKCVEYFKKQMKGEG